MARPFLAVKRTRPNQSVHAVRLNTEPEVNATTQRALSRCPGKRRADASRTCAGYEGFVLFKEEELPNVLKVPRAVWRWSAN
ncbi:uncharacterized protein SPSK_03804 [Sporothrix schenckii 1099-18]|uniref:Uncharacterized protein n=1 Tax=Sporothrix schenckii 1099-18 TaxID=1397361 RepID=A0A0F2LYR1_SPOSC|nr:uncharacterized protein SPSK_03804 [Sporothrix schenckii 1099-18]KJR82607.1 hypothetical protein SPSK_03804 [Sporothrix schenckii 1099-18]